MPDGVGCDSNDNARHETKERQADLPEVEAVDILEDEREGAEEEIQNAEEDGGEEAKVEAHGIEEKEEKGPIQRADDGPEDRSVRHLDGRLPSVVPGLVAFELGFLPEEDRHVCFWDEDCNSDEDDSGEDDEEVVAPTPGGVIVDETSHDGGRRWAKEGRGAVDKHRALKGLFSEHVADSATSDR